MLRYGVRVFLTGLQICGDHFVQPFLQDIHRGLHFFQAGLHLLWVGLRLFYIGLRPFLAGCRLFSLGILSDFHPFLMGVRLGYYIVTKFLKAGIEESLSK
jgi:hypothetical protein